MRRRTLLFAAGGLLAAPLVASGQQPVHRVAIVLTTSSLSEMAGPQPKHPLTRVLLDELSTMGYEEGRNLIFERRSAEGHPARYRGIIEELIALKTDVIVLSANRELIQTAHGITRTVPLVFMGYPRAVEDGFAASLARPGGNITGPGISGWQMEAKRLQACKETVPWLSRVAYLAPKQYWASDDASKVREAGTKIGVELVQVEQHPTDPDASFAALSRLRVNGVMVATSSTAFAQREQLGRLALAARLPGCFGWHRMVETGGLMSYGVEPLEFSRKVARYVDAILRGANPAELPIEEPTRFELIVNTRTAKTLGLTLPSSILLRADRVIE